MQAYSAVGFLACEHSAPEDGFEKLAIYELEGSAVHAARLKSDGRWTSKIGWDIDIEHDSLEALEGVEYGKVVAFMRRPLNDSTT